MREAIKSLCKKRKCFYFYLHYLNVCRSRRKIQEQNSSMWHMGASSSYLSLYRLLSLTEFTALMWWLYSCTVSPLFKSHCHSRLSLHAAMNDECSVG